MPVNKSGLLLLSLFGFGLKPLFDHIEAGKPLGVINLI